MFTDEIRFNKEANMKYVHTLYSYFDVCHQVELFNFFERKN